MPFIARAEEAGPLIRTLNACCQDQEPPSKVGPTVKRLHQLFPGYEFVWDKAWGVLIRVPMGEAAIPYSMAHGAAYIVRKTADGHELVKDRDNLCPQGLWPPPMFVQRPEPTRRTCFERVLEDDDF